MRNYSAVNSIIKQQCKLRKLPGKSTASFRFFPLHHYLKLYFFFLTQFKLYTPLLEQSVILCKNILFMLFCVKDSIHLSLTFTLGQADLLGKASNDIYEQKRSMRKRKKNTHCSDKIIFKIWKPDITNWGKKPQGQCKMRIIQDARIICPSCSSWGIELLFLSNRTFLETDQGRQRRQTLNVLVLQVVYNTSLKKKKEVLREELNVD